MAELVRIPGGTFDQGSAPWMLDWLAQQEQTLPRGWFSDEVPQQTVTLAPYLIDRYPVTVAEFRAFVQDTGYRTSAEEVGYGLVYGEQGWAELAGACWKLPAGPGDELERYLDHPVVHISWLDANAYAQWAGKRLPTESEWEFAARGSGFRIWPWGDTWHGANANTAEYFAGPMATLEQWRTWWLAVLAERGPIPLTTPVGTFSPAGDSPFGCGDLAGNVYEWTSTVSHLYGESAECDPTLRMVMGRYRVIRGGSWMNFRYQVRCSERMHGDPDGWSSFAIGFRCAVDA
ncbi:MAG TPA: SUMF1/EgtB/PvdO family nonheme iron enzyme [Micromonosporaceae bacterium]